MVKHDLGTGLMQEKMGDNHLMTFSAKNSHLSFVLLLSSWHFPPVSVLS